MASTAGESGQTGVGRAVYPACASSAWKYAIVVAMKASRTTTARIRSSHRTTVTVTASPEPGGTAARRSQPTATAGTRFIT